MKKLIKHCLNTLSRFHSPNLSPSALCTSTTLPVTPFSSASASASALSSASTSTSALSLALAFALTFSSPLLADEKADPIMDRVLGKGSWTSMIADVQLTLTNSRDEQRVRQIAFFSKDDDQGQNRLLMRFQAPADVRGTAFLTLERSSGSDERYLYLPAMRRVSRIASSGGGGNFMSSDFSYYDIGEPAREDWSYTYLRLDNVDGQDVHVIRAQPANNSVFEDTGYSSVIYYIDTTAFRTLRSEYFDKHKQKFKELSVLAYYEKDGHEFASDMLMTDTRIGHSSRMTFSSISLNNPVDDNIFTPRFLQRAR